MTTPDQSIFATHAMNWPRTAPEFAPLDASTEQPTGDADALGSIRQGQLAVWVERFKNLGVDAKRANCPSLSAQLAAALSRPIAAIYCSTLDTDASTCVQSAAAARFPLEVSLGVAMLARMLEPKSATILIDAAVPNDWINTLRPAAGKMGVRVSTLPNPYPQADPTLLMYSVAQRRMRPGTLPTDHGALLFDAVAAYAMGRALLTGSRVTDEPMVVRHHAANRSKFVLASKEMSVGRLLDRAAMTGGGFVRSGDLLRDQRIALDAPIADGERVFHVCPTEPPINPDPCTRCGWCVDVCPTRVHPAVALDAVQREDFDQADRSGIHACVECGLCTFVCPAQLPLLESIRLMKRRIAT